MGGPVFSGKGSEGSIFPQRGTQGGLGLGGEKGGGGGGGGDPRGQKRDPKQYNNRGGGQGGGGGATGVSGVFQARGVRGISFGPPMGPTFFQRARQKWGGGLGFFQGILLARSKGGGGGGPNLFGDPGRSPVPGRGEISLWRFGGKKPRGGPCAWGKKNGGGP